MAGRRILIFLSAALLFLGSALPAEAGDPSQARVGRVAVAEGKLTSRPAKGPLAGGSSPAVEWSDAGINHPVAAGMSVRTAEQARAVLRIGAETIAMSGDAELDLVQLDHELTRIALRRGRAGFGIETLDAARRIEIELPRGIVRLLGAGDYEIIAGGEHTPARIAVIDGAAHIAGKGLDADLGPGAVVLLGGNDPVALLPGGSGEDAFDAWWRSRRDPADLPALRHVSAAMTGYEALDQHGRWETVEDYGAVWFPQDVPENWAPFRFGHWRWLGSWGWTWVDDMPWGFAPSHYGRWANTGTTEAGPGRWGWVPGTRVENPAYMPAVVAFLGTAGVGLSYPDAFAPAVAWFPLAPGEVYWPAFTDDLDAIRRINAGAIADPAAIGPALNDAPPADIVVGEYRNRRFATVVPRSVFLGGKPVSRSLIELPPRRLENAPLLVGSPQISPPALRNAVMLSVGGESRPAVKATKAADTLGRILKSRSPEKRDAKKARAAKKRDVKSGLKAHLKKRQKARPSGTTAQARSDGRARRKRPPVAATRSRGGSDPKPRAASLRRADPRKR